MFVLCFCCLFISMFCRFPWLVLLYVPICLMASRFGTTTPHTRHTHAHTAPPPHSYRHMPGLLYNQRCLVPTMLGGHARRPSRATWGHHQLITNDVWCPPCSRGMLGSHLAPPGRHHQLTPAMFGVHHARGPCSGRTWGQLGPPPAYNQRCLVPTMLGGHARGPTGATTSL